MRRLLIVLVLLAGCGDPPQELSTDVSYRVRGDTAVAHVPDERTAARLCGLYADSVESRPAALDGVRQVQYRYSADGRDYTCMLP